MLTKESLKSLNIDMGMSGSADPGYVWWHPSKTSISGGLGNLWPLLPHPDWKLPVVMAKMN